jgi:hypothetical protein
MSTRPRLSVIFIVRQHLGHRMKYPLIFLFSLLALCGCSKSPIVGTRSYADVAVDGQHQMSSSTPKSNPYVIAAAPGVRLDVAHFQFTQGGETVIPDTVQVWDGSDIYRLAQPMVTNTFVLDASTLKVIHGAEFRGFRSGHTFIIGVGRATPGNMMADWVGLITVK